ncbi:excinuclease ABC subunit A [Sphingobium sp. B1D7B]|uniref:excinuclease ABC subunit UvrA n=1 Tax=Sphingobium TaxID=165695 RepID=UPI0015EBC25C|nr:MULTISPECIES: excinuclease ABC subunit UvrA [Sphingobium]MCW2362667.1 excinuclease ABC subunit A [Sphingobium sp. B10D3B]MCW2393164.1 excinuclease ABC subunit A [Sphingobium sp. B11D3A]MCW2400653.1 excinuclease ABC subunit A [Sphingobium sp. B10D7B]MCW2404968.1 excinuclease ABC subunit A [Sphingobium sp. B1D7B]MCW2407632.1 excinuclease ABC subunit A [Sphingobium xanthum]
MSLTHISVRGAREHNLKGIDVDLPRDALVVITGLSGSGKSSLAFDTIYAEGQRRYVESLSAYARQFLEMMQKPDVEHIDGLSPAISIEQKTTSRNPRSTVATVTEIYDYMRLLWARVGVPYSPATGLPISAQTVSQMVDRVLALPEGTRVYLLAPVVRGRKGEYRKELAEWQRAGFTRVRIDGEFYPIEEAPALDKKYKHDIEVVVDRVVVREDMAQRLAESFETALKLAEGLAYVDLAEGTVASLLNPSLSREGQGVGAGDGGSMPSSEVTGATQQPHPNPSPEGEGLKKGMKNAGIPANRIIFSEKFACPVSGFTIQEIEPRLFSFNAPQGACPACDGLGEKLEFDEQLVVPNEALTLKKGAIVPWAKSNPPSPYYMQVLASLAKAFGFSLETPWSELPGEVRLIILHGTGGKPVTLTFQDGRKSYSVSKPFEGVIGNLNRRMLQTDSAWMREELGKFQTAQPCETCGGARLKPEALAVKVAMQDIATPTRMSVVDALAWFTALPQQLTDQQNQIAKAILKEIIERLGFLNNVGLDYLNLDRTSGTLSGGESQRIRLASQIGSGLSGVLYVLDEPSIGLHQRDNDMLLVTLKRLRDLGNTVIVVEHDEDAIRAADHIVDMGPGAGVHGGEIVAQGTLADVLATQGSLTADYLNGTREIPVAAKRRKGSGKKLTVKNARANNLKGVSASIPLGTFTCITGVSGSGKSSFTIDTLYAASARALNGARVIAGAHDKIEGLEHLDKVIDIDQSPIGRTPRSNPATYTGAFTNIRDWFAGLPESQARGYKPGRFSFNVKGGRCEACQGDGVIKIEMHFLPDVYVTCEECHGKRYNRETLEVKFKGHSIADVLDMTVEDAVEFFKAVPPIRDRMAMLAEVGLGYVKVGQQATTLSGGEAQRVKLAKELSRRATGNTLYILDEPTTGLHFEDVRKLLEVLHALVEQGNSVVVIEHNLDVIKTADWIIDLGPEGGVKGGEIVATGTPEQVVKEKRSYTGRYLAPLLGKKAVSEAAE